MAHYDADAIDGGVHLIRHQIYRTATEIPKPVALRGTSGVLFADGFEG